MDEQIKQTAELLAVARHKMNEASDDVERLNDQWEKIVEKVDTARLEMENAERKFLEYCSSKKKK